MVSFLAARRFIDHFVDRPRFSFVEADSQREVIAVLFIRRIRKSKNVFSLLFSNVKKGALADGIGKVRVKVSLIPP
jgi:hypothetical protein